LPHSCPFFAPQLFILFVNLNWNLHARVHPRELGRELPVLGLVRSQIQLQVVAVCRHMCRGLVRSQVQLQVVAVCRYMCRGLVRSQVQLQVVAVCQLQVVAVCQLQVVAVRRQMLHVMAVRRQMRRLPLTKQKHLGIFCREWRKIFLRQRAADIYSYDVSSSTPCAKLSRYAWWLWTEEKLPHWSVCKLICSFLLIG
jgi:hypothetical protein